MSTKKPEYLCKNASPIGYTKIIVVLILSVMFLSASGCTDNGSDSSPVTLVTLTTNNDTYRSSEEMIINVDITASRGVDVTIVNISGIKNTFERNMLEDSKTVHLNEGDNTIQFTFETPECGDCAGVPAGDHTIYANVEIDGIQFNATSIVTLEEDEHETEETDGNETEDADENMTAVESVESAESNN